MIKFQGCQRNRRSFSGSKNNLHCPSQHSVLKRESSLQSNQHRLKTSQYETRGRRNKPYLDQKGKQNFQQGMRLFKEQSYESAVDCFKKCMTVNRKLYQCHYYIGLCLFETKLFEQALQQFKLYRVKNHKKPSVYLLMSVCFKKLGKFQQAITILTNLLNLFPSNSEGYFYRAKLFVKLKLFQQAEKDFSSFIKLCPENSNGYAAKADLLFSLGYTKNAIKLYSTAIQKGGKTEKIVMKRAKAYVQIRMFKEAEQDLVKLSREYPQDQQIVLAKALLYLKRGQLTLNYQFVNQAQLNLQLCFKIDPTSEHGYTSFQELVKLKIQQKNFYEAQHLLQSSLQFPPHFSFYRLFVQGVVDLIKKKYKQGIAKLQKALSCSNQSKKEVRVYMAYGLMHNKQLSEALSIYKQVLKEMQAIPTDQYQTIMYNKLICEGMIQYGLGQFNQAIIFFQEASQKCAEKAEPYFYKAVGLLKLYFQKKSEDSQILFASIKEFKHAVKLSKTTVNCQLHYYRALLLIELDYWSQALKDINLAIQNSDDHNQIYLYVRGIIHANMKQNEKACQDLKYCVESAKRPKALYYLAKISFNQQKYQRFQEYILQFQGLTNKTSTQLRCLEAFLNKRFKECLSLLMPAFQLPQWMREAITQLGRGELLQRVGKGQLSVQELRAFRKKMGLTDNDFNILKAILFFQKKNYNDSLKEFNNFIFDQRDTEDGRVTDARYCACLALLAKGQTKKGLENLKKLGSIERFDKITGIVSFIEEELAEEEEIFFQPFSLEISRQFQWTPVKFGKKTIFFRPMLSELQLEDPELPLGPDRSLLQESGKEELQVRGEAPWINKSKQGIIFTNKLQTFSQIEDSDESEFSQQQISQKERQQDHY